MGRCKYERDNMQCTKKASFNEPGESSAHFCKEHATDTMVNLARDICTHTDCDSTPSYGFDGVTPIFCKKHAQVDMIYRRKKICEGDGCRMSARFGLVGRTPLRCEACKLPGHRLVYTPPQIEAPLAPPSPGSQSRKRSRSPESRPRSIKRLSSLDGRVVLAYQGLVDAAEDNEVPEELTQKLVSILKASTKLVRKVSSARSQFDDYRNDVVGATMAKIAEKLSE